MNPIIFILVLSLAANGLLGWQWLRTRDKAATAASQLEQSRADANACSDATDDLRSLADKRKIEADSARAAAAAQAKNGPTDFVVERGAA